MSATPSLVELKYPIAFVWEKTDAAATYKVNAVTLVFQNAISKVSVKIPDDVMQNQSLFFHIIRGERESMPEKLNLKAEQIQHLTLIAHLTNRDGESDRSIPFKPPEKLQQGSYRLVVNSELTARLERVFLGIENASATVDNLIKFVCSSYPKVLQHMENFIPPQIRSDSTMTQQDKSKKARLVIQSCIKDIEPKKLDRLLEQFGSEFNSLRQGENIPQYTGAKTLNTIIEILTTDELKQMIRRYLVLCYPAYSNEICRQSLDVAVSVFKSALQDLIKHIENSTDREDKEVAQLIQNIAKISNGQIRDPSLDSCSISSLELQLEAAKKVLFMAEINFRVVRSTSSQDKPREIAALKNKLQALQKVGLLEQALQEKRTA